MGGQCWKPQLRGYDVKTLDEDKLRTIQTETDNAITQQAEILPSYDPQELTALSSCAHYPEKALRLFKEQNPPPQAFLFAHPNTETLFCAISRATRIGIPSRAMVNLALESIVEGATENDRFNAEDCREILASIYDSPAPKESPEEAFKALFRQHEEQQSPLSNRPTYPAPGTDLHDIGNGRRFASMHGDKVHQVVAWRKWLIWNGRQWIEDGVREVDRMAKQTAQRIVDESQGVEDERRVRILKHAAHTANKSRLDAMLSMAASEPGIAVLPDQFDADPWLLNCQNGTIDLRTGELRPHDRADMITKLAPVVFDNTSKCPNFEQFLFRVCGKRQSLVDFLQLALGYSLTGDTREHAVFIPYGSGRNGKSTLLELVADILGDYSIQMESKTLTARDRDAMSNDIARLRGARFAATSETGEGRRLDEEKIKRMAGGERLVGELKYGEPFEFVPEFKIWMATNHKPTIKGTDEGIWRRIHLIPFDVRFWDPAKGESGEADLRMNKDMPGILRREMSGILNWMLEGCLRWQATGLVMPEEVKAATREYREEQDVLAGFIAERCTLERQQSASAKSLYQAYCKWCDEMGEKPLSQKAVGQRLGERGLQSHHRSSGNVWQGIGLLEQRGLDV